MTDDADHSPLRSSGWVRGRRVRLIRCDDPHTRLKPGARGTVTFVDGLDTVHVAWDDGGRLGLIPGVDQWEFDTAAHLDDSEDGSGVWSGDHQP